MDDHPLFREGLKAIIEKAMEFEIAGEAGTGREALRLALELRPHLVIVDISLPDQSGIQLTKELCNLLPSAHVLIVSVHSGNNYFAEAFQAGAKGYLCKEAVPERLLRGLKFVSAGGYVLDEPVSAGVIEQLKGIVNSQEKTSPADCSALTPRQREVLELLALGYSYKVIGDMLCISPRTVEKHRVNIMARLNIAGKAELISFAAGAGLIRHHTQRI